MAEKNLTPTLKQYLDIKKQHEDKIVVFHMGDFYEMFMEDAILAAKILQIALTKRWGDTPMCGIPLHAANNYFYKLINAGQKIAVVDQVEKSSDTSTILKREVVRIITPGTVIDNNSLQENKNNFLLQLRFNNNSRLHVGAMDISTGEMECVTFDEGSLELNVYSALSHYEPREILVGEDQHDAITKLTSNQGKFILNDIPTYVLKKEYGESLIKKLYGITTLKSLGLEEAAEFIEVLSGLIYYLKNNYFSELDHLQYPKITSRTKTMVLDHATITNLELIRNHQDNQETNSLFAAINETLTSMGSRLLRNYILKPLVETKEIKNRQKKVQFLVESPTFCDNLRGCLKNIYDFERLLSKLSLNKITPKELLSLKNSLSSVLLLNDLFKNIESPFEHFAEALSLEKIIEQITDILLDEPNNDIREGGVIRDGLDEHLDRFRQMSKEGMDWIMKMLEKEKQQTKITNLKIKYTDNSGYFFEVTKSQMDNMPDYFIRKKTMVNGARYTTEELLQHQEDILSAREKAIELESEIYTALKNEVKKESVHLQSASAFCAEVDVFASFATTALRYNYTCPFIKNNFCLSIEGGRHPVMEQMDHLEFIPNDLQFTNESRIRIITGPNMGGKSTYLRQNALIVLLAQIGSFVPAEKAEMSVCDRIFTRIGASDNLLKGESTFLLEMSETAYILAQATENSLIIMDEIGRGTSTYDGLSLAWSIIEFIRGQSGPKSRTLFATHYHELTKLESYQEINNYHVSVIEKEKKLLFTKKVIEGAADKSYGIHVAELAGLPKEVIRAAEKKLIELEKEKASSSKKNANEMQMSILETKEPSAYKEPLLHEEPTSKEKELSKALNEFDANNSTPMEGLLFIQKLKKML